MSDHHDRFDEEQKITVSVWAVNELVSDAQTGRVKESRELAEAVIACIRHTEPRILRELKFLLERRGLASRPECDPAL